MKGGGGTHRKKVSSVHYNQEATQSVGGGDRDMDFGLSNNSRHFNEAARLKEVFKLYTTLEESPMAEDIEDDDDEDTFLQGFM